MRSLRSLAQKVNDTEPREIRGQVSPNVKILSKVKLPIKAAAQAEAEPQPKAKRKPARVKSARP